MAGGAAYPGGSARSSGSRPLDWSGAAACATPDGAAHAPGLWEALTLVAVVGIALVIVAAIVVAVHRGGQGWWRFFLGGAAGWVVAQLVKSLLLAPFTLQALHGGGAAAATLLAVQWWFIGAGALLPGVVEELGKYLPLRWLRVGNRGSALALGLGAGAVEALVLGAEVFALAGHGQSLAGALIAVWERFWAVGFHAGSAALDGLAVVRGQARWLVLAMALHTAVDLGAAWYQHAAAVSAPAGTLHAALLLTELSAAVVAVLAWWLAGRLWARTVAA